MQVKIWLAGRRYMAGKGKCKRFRRIRKWDTSFGEQKEYGRDLGELRNLGGGR